jgi:hypothetical protein
MSVKIIGNSGTVAEVDGSGFRALRTASRPIDVGTLGAYSVSVVSGTLAAALAANAVVFAFRWTHATNLAIVTRINVKFQALTLFTAATLTDFGFDAYVGRSYSASHTGGTALTMTGNNSKMRTSMGTSLVGDIRIATTAALGGGTITVDAHPFAASLGDTQTINPAAATEEQRVNDPTLDWSVDLGAGDYPLVLANNEGFVIRNRAVWPAAGTGIVQVTCRWSEVASF